MDYSFTLASLGHDLKRRWEDILLVSRETQWYTWSSTFIEREGTQFAYIQTHGQWQMIRMERREDKDWTFRSKNVWGRNIWMDLLEWAQDVKIFVLDVNAHQSAYTMEEALNNQLARMTWLVNISQALSSAIQCWHNEYTNRITKMVGWKLCTGLII